MSAVTLPDSDALFASFDIEELEVLEISDNVALPQMGASALPSVIDVGASTEPISLCCSSASSTCCSC